jgi:phosphoribosylanthranilate isomerase
MALKTLVKVGSITNLSDARYCAGMGVEFLGFRVIEGQPGSISAKLFQEIRGWVTGPQIVAEIYGITDVTTLPQIVESFRPDYFELGVADYLRVGAAIDLPYILSLKPGEELPAMLHSRPAYILTDIPSASSSKLIPEHELLVEVSDIPGVQQILHQTGISGISLHGGVEIRPGLKQYDELAEILESLEED